MLTQLEADILLALEKLIRNARGIKFPNYPGREDYELVSIDQKEKFILTVSRNGKIRRDKCSYSKRYRNVIILLRLDNDGRPHINPDGEEIPCPHLHIYREGYYDAWAFPVPESFRDTDDLVGTLLDLLRYSNVINIDDVQVIQGGLFDDYDG